MVSFSVSLPMTEAEFTDEKKTTFKKATADAASMSVDKVSITKVFTKLRRAGEIKVEVAVKAKDVKDAEKISGLLTEDSINTKLEAAGLPKAKLVDKPAISAVSGTTMLSSSMSFPAAAALVSALAISLV